MRSCERESQSGEGGGIYAFELDRESLWRESVRVYEICNCKLCLCDFRSIGLYDARFLCMLHIDFYLISIRSFRPIQVPYVSYFKPYFKMHAQHTFDFNATAFKRSTDIMPSQSKWAIRISFDRFYFIHSVAAATYIDTMIYRLMIMMRFFQSCRHK